MFCLLSGFRKLSVEDFFPLLELLLEVSLVHLLPVHFLLVLHALVSQALVDGLELRNFVLVASQLVRELLVCLGVGRLLTFLLSVEVLDHLKVDVTTWSIGVLSQTEGGHLLVQARHLTPCAL